ncbi:MAG: hypothetical protein A2X13_05590 [Bacteroidetes bacterium GWC2_33_15]|nr:MAG: hypothetical protein A2X10_00275 [Bacteroidetes bacterium GWA2_33_15]OFX51966.1 MAG: hypothetical protein A2X13_05590 [Bacteroidetes bacterium GWC2_33_15]OFX63796.1 MAG: hypothetical protein A2X15_00515 [Bacteroidetes bacterium GWB2_32_14]OFX67369.1 MAG: hypothetical protein A2X14_12320 [Bacteroidetes bacterium GWD2_33_33]HAN17870.1 hypothetical protein [Bacteroidales bacterium]
MNTQFLTYAKKNINLYLAFISVLILFFTYSCKDEASMLGADLLPDDDRMILQFDTTITFISYLNDEEDFSTKNYTTAYVGNINDPYFGSLNGSLAIQYYPKVIGNKIDTIEPDSAILYFRIDNTYGDFIKNENFNIYILSTSLSSDSTYLNTTSIQDFYYDEAFPINTSVFYSGDTLIGFPLSSNFINYLLPNNDYVYDTLSLFLDYYKGICVIPEENTGLGSMIKLSLESDDSKISLFYNDSLTFDYTFSLGVSFSNYTHDKTGAIINNYLENDSTEADTLMFMQGFGGMTSKIILSDISRFKNAKYSILTADLFIPVFKDNNFEFLTPPDELYFLYPTSDTTYYYIPDDDPTYSDFFDGSYYEDNDYYKFNISKYLTALLAGDISDSLLKVRIRENYSYPNRVILKTGENIKLKVTYTKH